MLLGTSYAFEAQANANMSGNNLIGVNEIQGITDQSIY